VPGLLGLDDLAPGDVAVLFEGEFDGWLAWRAMDDDPAFVRVTAMTLDAATHLLDRNCRWQLSPASRIVSAHDNDWAGRHRAGPPSVPRPSPSRSFHWTCWHTSVRRGGRCLRFQPL
jgi:hypothetical protein